MRILIIAPYFAPYTEVPAIRMISLSQYLIEHGHTVEVYCFSRKMLLTKCLEKDLRATAPDSVVIHNFDISNYSIPLFSDIFYGKEFTRKIRRDIPIETYDAVLITCGPYFTLEAVPYIASRTKNCLLDFRDLGALNYRPRLKTENDEVKRSAVKEFGKHIYLGMIKKRERKAVSAASTIITVSQIGSRLMKDAYKIDNSRMLVASNGYDERALENLIIQKREENEIVIGVFGKFMYYSVNRAIALLKSVSALRENGHRIKLMHIGPEYPWIEQNIKENGIDENCYEGHGVMGYREGMSLLGNSDFFAVEDTSPDDVGTKIYDYIYFNKPIIASVPQDIPIAKLVGRFRYGYVCSSEAEIASALRELIAIRPKVLDPNLEPTQYSRSHQNGIICQALEKGVNR